MKYLIILDKYLPNPEANGLCMESIVRQLNADHLTVICRVTDEKLAGRCRIDDRTEAVAVYYPAEKKYDSRGSFGKLLYVAKHILGSFFGVLPDMKLAKLFSAAALEQMEQKSFDWIITLLNPIEAVAAGQLVKERHPDLGWFIYDLDSASNCSIGKIEKIFRKQYSRKVLKWEKSVFKQADLIVHLDCHDRHFRQDQYHEFREKMLFQGVPLLNASEMSDRNEISGGKSLVYAGAFYRRLREPDILLDIVSRATAAEPSIELDIYTKNDYVQTLAAKTVSDRIHVHGFVDQKTLQGIIGSHTALISLGNRTTEMFPSKIISYVAACKPIIHIYQNMSDPVIPFLKQYANALLLDGMAEPETNAMKLVGFLTRKHQAVSADDINKVFERYTGSYCAREIRDFLASKGKTI